MRHTLFVALVAVCLVVFLAPSPAQAATAWDFTQNWDSGYSYQTTINSDGWYGYSDTGYSYTGAFSDTYYVNSYSYSAHLGGQYQYAYSGYTNCRLKYTFSSATQSTGTLSFWYYCYYSSMNIRFSADGSNWVNNEIHPNYTYVYGATRSIDVPSGTKYIEFWNYVYCYYNYYGLHIDNISYKMDDVSVTGITGFSSGLNTGTLNLTASTMSLYSGVDYVEWQYMKSLDPDWSGSYFDSTSSNGFTWNLDLTGKDDLAFSVRARCAYGASVSKWHTVTFKVQNYHVTMTPPNPNGGDFSFQVSVTNDLFEAIYPPNPWTWVGNSYYSSGTYNLVNAAGKVPFTGTATQFETNFYMSYGSYTFQFILYSQVSGSTAWTAVATSPSQYYATGRQFYELTGSQWSNLAANLQIGITTYYRGYHYYSSYKPYTGNPELVYYNSVGSTYWYSNNYYSIPLRVVFETKGNIVESILPAYRIGTGGSAVAFSSSAVSKLTEDTFLVNWKSWAVDSDQVYVDIRVKAGGEILDTPFTFGPYSIRNRTNATFNIAQSPGTPGTLALNTSDPLVYLTIDNTNRKVPYTTSVPYFTEFDSIAPKTIPDTSGAIWRFDRWSDGGARQHDAIVSPQQSNSYTAYYAKQYYFGVISSRPEFVAPSFGYYDPGTTLNVQVSPYSYDGQVTRYRYTGYSVLNTSISGTDPWQTYVLDRRTEVQLNWQLEYYFSVENTLGTGTGSADGWYSNGTVLNYSVPQTVANGSGSRMDNRGHLVNGSLVTGPQFSGAIQAPTVVSFEWMQQYYLTTTTNFGTATPQPGWYDQGTVVQIDTQSPPADVDRNYFFEGWNGTGEGSVTTQGLPTAQQVAMNGQVTQTAVWTVQYLVELTPMNGTITSGSSGWYPAGTVLTVTIAPPSAGTGSRWLPSWAGTGASSYTAAVGENTPTSVTLTVNSPIVESIEWFLQHTLTVANADGIGRVNPEPGSYWLFDGDMAVGLATFLVGDKVCAGFAGTGSVENATTPYFSFEITAPSTVSWNWKSRVMPGEQDWSDAEQLMELASPYAYALARDAQGEPAIAWYDPATSSIKFAHMVGGALEVSTLAQGLPQITEFDLLLDAGGNPHLTYYHPGDRDLHYVGLANPAKADSTAEPSHSFNLPGDAGSHPHIAMNENGDIFISFYDLGMSALRVAIRWAETGTWVVETVDTVGNPGLHNSISIRPQDGSPAVAYHALTGRDLRYAWRSAEGWVAGTVDDEGSQGHYPALAHTPDGVPHIVYQDVSDTLRFHLRFATLGDAGWTTATVDNTDGTGFNPSLFIDGEGVVHIAYHNQAKAFYARYDRTNWITMELTGSAVEGETMVLLNSEMKPSVVFNDGGILKNLDAKTPVGGGGNNGGGGETPIPTTGGGGGCFVATASFGSISASELVTLTTLRDTSVATSRCGSSLVGLYYATSPSVARIPAEQASFRALVRSILSN